MSLVTHAQCHECDEVGQDYLTAVGRCSVWISMSLRVANTTLTAISYAKNDVKVPREATLRQFTSSLCASSSAIAPCANWVGGPAFTEHLAHSLKTAAEAAVCAKLRQSIFLTACETQTGQA